MSGDPVTPGYYGKLPARGDFVSRHLGRDFLEPWDAWMQQAIARSRKQLGRHWLDAYLTSPLWRFALSAGVCGGATVTGVWMPSVDRVGRYFPMVIAVSLPGTVNLLALVEGAESWFMRAEEVALGGLDEPLDLEDFSRRVQALGAPPHEPLAADDGAPAWHCPLANRQGLGAVRPALADHLLVRSFPRATLWWSRGSEQVKPCLLLCQGLPPVQSFVALLTGEWNRRGWAERRLAG